MKSLIKTIYISIFLITLILPDEAYPASGDVETAEFKVEGVCGMCKDRIENGALIKGVKKAEWDKETEMLTVIYNPDKVELLDIHKAIAELGHSTEKVKAEETAYNKLPMCCQYDDGAHKH
jgi:cation transport ATPase